MALPKHEMLSPLFAEGFLFKEMLEFYVKRKNASIIITEVVTYSSVLLPELPLKGTHYAKFTFTWCLNINLFQQSVYNYTTMVKIHLLLSLHSS